MKFKARMDIDLSENDLIEKEVQDAFKAYAKNVARETIQEEISKEIKRVAANHVLELQRKSWYSVPRIEQIIKDEISGMIKKETNNMEDIKRKINDSVTKTYSDQEKEISAYVNERVHKVFNNLDIEKYIIDAIEKAIPKVLIAHMANNLKA